MPDYRKYHLGTAHDGEDYWSRSVSVPDYYPLTDEEIAELLWCAQQVTDPREISSIELRFYQGIWGFTSLYPLHGRIDCAARQVSLVYRQNYQAGPSPELVGELCCWMHSTFPGTREYDAFEDVSE